MCFYFLTFVLFHFIHRHVATLVSGNVTVEGDSILTFPTKNLPTVPMQIIGLTHILALCHTGTPSGKAVLTVNKIKMLTN